MTIARGLTLLAALPLLILIGLGLFAVRQLEEIKAHSRFVEETQINSLTVLGEVARCTADMRVAIRNYVITNDKAERARAEVLLRTSHAELSKLLAYYADNLITGEKDRRLHDQFQDMSNEWLATAEKVMADAATGHWQDSMGWLLASTYTGVSTQWGAALSDWIQLNKQLAADARNEDVAAIADAQRSLLTAAAIGVLLMGLLGFITFRRIAHPIRALQTSVESFAAGDYEQAVPFTEATDETGALARSIDVLKQGSAAMEAQRWVKTNAADLSGPLQSATSLAEFGERFLCALVPLLRGGVAGFYVFDAGHNRLRRIASYGFAEDARGENLLNVGEGLAGQCARETVPTALASLPPGYLRISSALGEAPPVQAAAWPLMARDTLLGVIEFASFQVLNAREKALLDELLPLVAMNLQVLSRNIATRELLARTQEQAGQLEEQKEELTRSHEKLLAQKEQLRASEERSRLILESSSEGIFGTDTDGRVTFVNPAACQMLGFAAEELLGQQSHARFHHHRPDGNAYPKEECPMFAAYAYGKASRIDDEVLWRKDGSGLPVEYGATPVYRDDTVVGAVVSFTDITERKRAEQLLRETEQFFRSVLELAPDALMVVDSMGGIQLTNVQGERLFGYTRDELIGHSVDMLVPTDVRPGHASLRAGFHRAPVRREMGARRELNGLRKDGSLFPIEIGLSPLPATQTEEARVAVSIRDITARKRQERELVEAKLEAEEATAAKSMFLANMSHEIRTPMNAIIGMTHLALKTDLTPKQRDYLSKVRGAAGSLLGIINDILDFSKIEAGKLDIENAEFWFNDVLENLSTVVAQKAQEKNLEFLISAQNNIPPNLVGDPLRVGQVLINLVNNAVKFTEHGEVIVSVGIAEQIEGRVKLKFSVRDTGIGMTPEQSARLFQAFSQADLSTTRKFGGTGLGLSISKRLVEMMGGTIWAESEAGVGSTFHCTAWFGIGSSGQERMRFVPDLAGIRTLVVDDNAQAREILSDAVRGFALRADTVNSGPEAIQALAAADAADPYQLVLMDWNMPGMDGLQASAMIKRDDRLKNQPRIVIVTAFGREEVRSQAETMGIDGYILKPVNASVLYDTLMDLFGAAGSEPRGARHGKGEDTEYNAKGIRVLLVEDNDMNQQVATELLESAGALVTVAGHGGIAVKLLREGPQPPSFDIVLMDLQMPEMDGHEATRLLRADPRFNNLPILAMTAHALAEERERCLQEGMNDHVSKPIDPDALFAAIARWVKPREAPAAPAVEKAPAPPVEQLPEIEGVDIAGGLKRVAGNKRLFRSLLEQFAAKQADAGVQIAEALSNGDRALAERLAHTVKGVAGNIGIGAVQAAAGQVEKAIRENDAAAPALLVELEMALGPQVRAIRNALGESAPAAAPAAAFNAEEAAAAVERLRSLIEANDGDAADAAQTVAEALAGRVEAPRLGALRAAIDEFDFDAALSKLDEIAKECKLGAE